MSGRDRRAPIVIAPMKVLSIQRVWSTDCHRQRENAIIVAFVMRA